MNLKSLITVTSLLFLLQTAFAQKFELTFIDYPQGQFTPSGLNDSGQICGTVLVDPDNLILNAFRYEPDGSFTLLTLGKNISSAANDINDLGQILGRVTDSTFASQYVVWVSPDSFRILEPHGPFSLILPQDLNNLGEAVGFVSSSIASIAIYWDADGNILELPHSGVASEARAINDMSQIVGRVIYEDGSSRAVLWEIASTLRGDSVYVENVLPTLGGNRDDARTINIKSQIGGSAAINKTTVHPVLWNEFGIIDLTPEHPYNGVILAINDLCNQVGEQHKSDQPFDVQGIYISGETLEVSPLPSCSIGASWINNSNTILAGPCLYTQINETNLLRDTVIAIANALLRELENDTIGRLSFTLQNPLPPWTHIQSADPFELDLIIPTDTWVTWWTGSDLRYAQPSGVILHGDSDTASPIVIPITWWLSIDGVPYLSSYNERIISPDLTSGTFLFPDTLLNLDLVVDSTISAIANDSVCAILVSGAANKASKIEQEAFDFDLDVMESTLTHAPLGPRLPKEKVIKLKNPTQDQVCNQLDSLKDRYNKIIFFYSGHGDKNEVQTSKSNLSYKDLADKLKNTNANDICVVIDACHAGAAIDSFDLIFDKSDQNLTLVTSSAATKSSLTLFSYEPVTKNEFYGSFFTWYFNLCYSDPKADTDGEEGTSKREAFTWLAKTNPKHPKRGEMNSIMNPHYFAKSSIKTEKLNSRTYISNLALELESNSATGNGVLFMEQRNGIDNTPVDDESIIFVIPDYFYGIEFEEGNQRSEISLNIGFSFNPDILDSLSAGKKLGLVKRDNNSDPWRSYLPTELDTENNFIRALNVSEFSEWAIAIVKAESTGLDIFGSGVSEQVVLNQNFPNPFHQWTTIGFSLKVPKMVEFRFYNLLGQQVKTLAPAKFGVGDHQVTWDGRGNDGSVLESGIYYYHIGISDQSRSTGYQYSKPRALFLIH